jgi:hypothetical protein
MTDFEAAVTRSVVSINLAAFLRALAEQNSREAEGAADALVRAAVALLGHGPN